MDEQNDQLKIEVIEVYERPTKKDFFLRGTVDISITLQNLKIELREISWSVRINSKKILVLPPSSFKNTKVEGKTVKKHRRIIKFEPNSVHQLIAEAIQKEVEELYKDEIEQHRKEIDKGEIEQH